MKKKIKNVEEDEVKNQKIEESLFEEPIDRRSYLEVLKGKTNIINKDIDENVKSPNTGKPNKGQKGIQTQTEKNIVYIFLDRDHALIYHFK
jgi:hypothetical protein